MLRFCFVATLTMILSSCATALTAPVSYQEVDFNALPEIAVEYQSFIQSKKTPAHIHVWQLIRTGEKIEILDSTTNTSEVWSQTSNGLWFYEKVFHEDKQIIVYSPEDLKILGITPPWSSLALAVDPHILASIGRGRWAKPLRGWQRQEFKGTYHEADYEIDWLPELRLASRVKRAAGGVTTVTTATAVFLLADSPWERQTINTYRLIDYSDLGDMERDPFVIKIQGRLPGTHDHAHP